MSGITLRHQVKPSVLQIHKFSELSEKNATLEDVEEEPIEHSTSSDVRQLFQSPQEMRKPSATMYSRKHSVEVSNRCSFLRSSKYCKFGSSSSLLKEDVWAFTSTPKYQSVSNISLKSTKTLFYCEWFPKLFGVDEEVIASEEEPEGGEEMLLGEGEEEVVVKKEHIPRYGRRARAKPVLERGVGEKFDCICNIDETFERHYIPHFGGGVKGETDEWRTPHFASYWEEYKEDIATQEDAELMQILETKPSDEKSEAIPYSRPKLKMVRRKIQDYRREVLSSLRPLDCRELRRYRMPYSEAILLEMEEDGYIESADFLKSLLIEEFLLDQTREECDTLRESKTKIHRIVQLLTAAEKKGRKLQFNGESGLLLKAGKYFCDNNPCWWWLVERLYDRAVLAGSKCVIDGGKSEAIARYIFGTFLLENAGKVHLAQLHLTKARQLSAGRDWNAGKILNKKLDPIHKECCNSLCRALVATSRQLRKEGKPQDALKFIHQSYKLCTECTSRQDIEEETYFELGLTYQATGQLDWAKVAFKKFIALVKIHDDKNTKSICNGHLELAICYRMSGDLNLCHHHLQAYLDYATANKDENLEAFGNRYLGEFLMNHGYSKEAVVFFEKAFFSFLNQCRQTMDKPFSEWLIEDFTLPQDVELARALTGLAKGELLTKPICHLILRARDVRNQNDTLKLLKWKNSQEIWFEGEAEYKEEGEGFEKSESSEKSVSFELEENEGEDFELESSESLKTQEDTN